MKSISIAKKDLSIYYLRAPVIIQGLLIPAFMFISFSIGRDIPPEFLLPGLLGMALFFSVSAITPVIAPWETRMRTFERIVSCPIRMWQILLGDVIASVLFGLFITSIVIAVATVIMGLSVINVYLVLALFLGAFCFSSIGTLMSSHPADSPSNVMLFSTLIKFPLVFISGVFIPINDMGYFKLLSYLSPLTYFTDIARKSFTGRSRLHPVLSLIILFTFSALFFLLSVIFHKKNLSKRF